MSTSSSSLGEGAFPRRNPNFPMFDSNAVGIATFFGSPVVGSSLMAWNYQRLGQTGKAVLTVVLATVATVLVVLATWNLKPGATGVLGLVLFIAMQQIAKLLQGRAVSAHVQEGGALGSKWTAFWLGIAFLVVVFGVVFLYVMATTVHNSVKVGNKDEVIYTDGASKGDAQTVGKALKADGFFTDRGVSVVVGKEKDGRPVMGFPVPDGAWNESDKVAAFEEVGREMAPLLGGYPIKVQLMDTTREVKKEVLVGRAEFPGNDDVFYQGGVTQAQAQGVGEALKSANFFEGHGVDVFVAKDGGVTTISFVTNSKAWGDPEMLSGFEKLARTAAPSLGGLPIHLQLVDNALVVKKDEVVQ
jgi:hypothetical protein